MKSRTIKFKLISSFSILVLLMIGISAKSLITMQSSAESTERLLDGYILAEQKAAEIHLDLLTARRHEKDFIARTDTKYVDRMATTLDDLNTQADFLHRLGQDLNLAGVVAESQ